MVNDERIDLTVPYARKEEAKALGARWDPSLRTWFVPPGIDLTGFDAKWLPSEIARIRDGAGEEAVENEKGIPLSELLTIGPFFPRQGLSGAARRRASDRSERGARESPAPRGRHPNLFARYHANLGLFLMATVQRLTKGRHIVPIHEPGTTPVRVTR
jgi:Domain of unknown function (DUF5710)